MGSLEVQDVDVFQYASKVVLPKQYTGGSVMAPRKREAFSLHSAVELSSLLMVSQFVEGVARLKLHTVHDHDNEMRKSKIGP